MATPVSAITTSSAAAAAPAATAPPKAAATPAPAAEDTVNISATAQEIQQPLSTQVLLLHNQGQSIPQIATQLAISPSAVQSYLGTPPATPGQ
ncbi:MAG: helix-turn-helix domain-containing protein [Candidatus Acidiferrales bacterium]